MLRASIAERGIGLGLIWLACGKMTAGIILLAYSQIKAGLDISEVRQRFAGV